MIILSNTRDQDHVPFYNVLTVTAHRNEAKVKMARFHFRVVLFCAILIGILCSCIFCYEPNWKSLDTRKNPEWFDEGKIGIFLHWGVYSVPGNMVWFWYFWKRQKLPEFVQFMKEHYPPNFQYADFAPDFRAEFFDADKWAKILKASGARLQIFFSFVYCF